MSETKKVVDFLNAFENLSKDEQEEVVKKLMPKICPIVMKDKTMIKEMMPVCMEMMQGIDFPMKEMMSKMMGKA